MTDAPNQSALSSSPAGADGGPAQFRLFQPGDEDAIIRIFDASFDRWPPFSIPDSQREFLEWYLEPHETFRAYAVVSTVEDEVAAVNCTIRRPILVHGAEWRGAAGGAGTAVDPRFRRMGIYAAGREWRHQHLPVDVHLRFTQTEAHHRAQRTAGRSASPIGNRLSVFLRVLSPSRAAAEQSRRLLRWPGYAALRLRGAVRSRRAATPEGFEIRALDAFDDDQVARFWEQAAAPWDLIPVRNAEFLNWRWCDPRVGPFTVLAATEGDALLGYIVIRAAGIRGHLPDMLVLPGRDDVSRALIDAGVKALNASGVGAVECWMMEHHPYADVLRRAGFVRLGGRSDEVAHKLGIESRRHPEALEPLADPYAAIHVVEADSDLI